MVDRIIIIHMNRLVDSRWEPIVRISDDYYDAGGILSFLHMFRLRLQEVAYGTGRLWIYATQAFEYG